jgi:hypothetical protein
VIGALVDIPAAGAEGVLFAHGNRFGGHGLYVKDNRLHYVNNFVGAEEQMVVGTEDLRFGRDLPLPPPSKPELRSCEPESDAARYRLGAFFPRHLERLDARATWAVWQRHDRSLGQGRGTAINNWLRYGERLSFLVNMFRSRRHSASTRCPTSRRARSYAEPVVAAPTRPGHGARPCAYRRSRPPRRCPRPARRHR